MPILQPNSVLLQRSTNDRYRVYFSDSKTVVLFTLPLDPNSRSRACRLVEYSREKIEGWLKSGRMEILEEHLYHPLKLRFDPPAPLPPGTFEIEVEYPEPTERYLAIQHHRFLVVQDIMAVGWEKLVKDLSGVLRSVAAKHEVHVESARAWFCTFCIREMVPAALWPAYENSGGRGKPREPGEAKRGTTVIYAETGGCNVSPTLRGYIREFILDNLKGMKSVHELYGRYCDRYGTQGWRVGDDGVTRPVHFPRHMMITEESFQKYFYEDREYEADGIRRYGEAEWQRRRRAKLGNEGARAQMPGSIYQMDFTRMNIIVVHPIFRFPIGRPSFGLTRDVASPMIPGFIASMRNPSANLGFRLFENAVLPKIPYCRRFGVTRDIPWHVHGLPGGLTIDNGEWRGPRANVISKQFGVPLENVRAYYSPDKGTIESAIGQVKNGEIDHLPGRASRYRQRGEGRCELDAQLSLYALTRILIETFLLQMEKPMDERFIPPGAIRDGQGTSAFAVWDWSMNNGFGGLREEGTPDQIRLLTLPSCSVLATGQGIKFRQLTYSCEPLRSYFSRRRQKSEPIVISHDDEWVDTIYAHIDREVIPLDLGQKDMAMYGNQNLTRDDVKLAKRQIKKKSKGGQHAYTQKESDVHATVESIVDTEKTLTKMAQSPTAYSFAPDTLREAKGNAAVEERKAEAHRLDVGTDPKIITPNFKVGVFSAAPPQTDASNIPAQPTVKQSEAEPVQTATEVPVSQFDKLREAYLRKKS